MIFRTGLSLNRRIQTAVFGVPDDDFGPDDSVEKEAIAMRRLVMQRLRRAIILFIVLAGLSEPTDLLGQELTAVEAQSIAREATIYGYPIVETYRTMFAFAIDRDGEEFKSPFNTLKHEANVFTPADKGVVTPNADTPYSFLWIDLRREPVVLGVPAIEKGRYYSIQLTDLFKFNFDYIGSRTTGNGAGQYMIVGPNWTGEPPTNIDKIIRCETEFALAIYRTQLLGPDDLVNVKRIQLQYTVNTLSELLDEPKPGPETETEFPLSLPDTGSNLEFFSTLNFVCSSVRLINPNSSS